MAGPVEVPGDLSRRVFLRQAGGAFLALAGLPALAERSAAEELAAASQAGNPFAAIWQRPREVVIHRQATGERRRLLLWDPREGWLRDGYVEACRMLRDVVAGEVRQIDLGLLNMLYAIQSWYLANGVYEPLVVTSGYRNPVRNRGIEGAARNSMHTYGKAVDMRVRGLTTAQLWQMSAALRAGGVGYYPGKGFVHIDTGRLRYWQG
ncbi:YcbK family protein [Chromobacterium sp. CV08]|uniref:YcbK family protein n=1 Tax=Chromobacterium sp. CV08 TaxID=3133274 RepID=UPI003DA8A31F